MFSSETHYEICDVTKSMFQTVENAPKGKIMYHVMYFMKEFTFFIEICFQVITF